MHARRSAWTEQSQNCRVHIVGGGRGIGRWMARHCFVGHTTHCYDIDGSVCPGSTVHWLRDGSFGPYRSHFHPGDWILLAIPAAELRVAVDAIREVADPRSLVVPLMSVQVEAMTVVR